MDGRRDFVAIDFGTSNSAVALPALGPDGRVQLLALEDGAPTMPTAVFYRADTPASQPEAERLVGRAARQELQEADPPG